MKTLYLDCGMGAAGDMLTAALLELAGKEKIEMLNSLHIPHVEYISEEVSKCGIYGTHMKVLVHGHEEMEHSHEEHDHKHEHHHEHEEHDHKHEHHHAHGYHLHDIEHIVSHMDIKDSVKKDILEVYTLIAQAESEAHHKPISDIHFHEVGSLDAIADVSAVCVLMDELNVDQVICSPIHVGSGSVKCAHGILPVPAPATASILRGVPIYSTDIQGELCTPTGAALLKYFVSKFDNMPMMTVDKIGHGMGMKNFERANMVTAYLGETSNNSEDIIELSCNLDDMSAEYIAFAMDQLLSNGALDVYTTPITMKKSRLATMLSVLCKEENKDELVTLLFKHTSTLGIRENRMKRYTLNRNIEEMNTNYGIVHVKKSSSTLKYEFDDISKIAKENDWSLKETIEKIEAGK